MSNLPLALTHPILLSCGIILCATVLVAIAWAIPDIIRYIKITWV
jgi:hypothetical protein